MDCGEMLAENLPGMLQAAYPAKSPRPLHIWRFRQPWILRPNRYDRNSSVCREDPYHSHLLRPLT